jgi:hypothetical protein
VQSQNAPNIYEDALLEFDRCASVRRARDLQVQIRTCESAEAALSTLQAQYPNASSIEQSIVSYSLAGVRLNLGGHYADQSGETGERACTAVERAWVALGDIRSGAIGERNLAIMAADIVDAVEPCRAVRGAPEWGRPLPPQ